MDIFRLTRKPDPELFYSRGDKNDIRLGDAVRYNEGEYEAADVVILGSPQDIGVKRNKGREGAKKAPSAIRAQFYKLNVSENLKNLKLFDAGDVITEGTLEDIHSRQEEIVFDIIQRGKKCIILGGGNDISYPDCKALCRQYNKPLVLNIDSHFDVRDSEKRNSGTPYRMLLDEGLINGSDFYEIGIKSYHASPVYEKYLLEKGARIYNIEKVRQIGLAELLDGIAAEHDNSAIFWGFDMDVVRAFAAPGVSAPGTYGFTVEEAATAAKIAGNLSGSKIFEISEVNPDYDIDGRTANLAAVLMWNFINSIEY